MTPRSLTSASNYHGRQATISAYNRNLVMLRLKYRLPRAVYFRGADRKRRPALNKTPGTIVAATTKGTYYLTGQFFRLAGCHHGKIKGTPEQKKKGGGGRVAWVHPRPVFFHEIRARRTHWPAEGCCPRVGLNVRAELYSLRQGSNKTPKSEWLAPRLFPRRWPATRELGYIVDPI